MSKQTLLDILNAVKERKSSEIICLKTSSESITIKAPDCMIDKKTYKTATADAIVKSDKDVEVFVRDAYLENVLGLIDSSDIIMHISDLFLVITPKKNNCFSENIVAIMVVLANCKK